MKLFILALLSTFISAQAFSYEFSFVKNEESKTMLDKKTELYLTTQATRSLIAIYNLADEVYENRSEKLSQEKCFAVGYDLSNVITMIDLGYKIKVKDSKKSHQNIEWEVAEFALALDSKLCD